MPVWSDAPPGDPAITPYTLPAGADSTTLTAKEGLSGNVTRMVELPGGGMAFGSDCGLSILDGKQIRTYTGPAFAAASMKVTPGNSALPGNQVQDLLVDSRGRLWVGTTEGVCVIDPAKPGAWKILKKPAEGLFDHSNFAIGFDPQRLFERSDGTIVLGGRDETIIFIDPKTDTLRTVHREVNQNHWITGIAEDNQHRLWFSIEGVGIFRFDHDQLQPVPGTEKLSSTWDGARRSHHRPNGHGMGLRRVRWIDCDSSG